MKIITLVLLIVSNISIGQTILNDTNTWNKQSSENPRLIPFYGTSAVGMNAKNRDLELIDSLKKSGLDIKDIASFFTKSGANQLQKGNLDSAMFDFNKAWIADSTLITSYIGISTVYRYLEIEKFHLMALEKAKNFCPEYKHELLEVAIEGAAKELKENHKQATYPDGEHVEKYETGEVYSVGSFLNGKETGTWTWYYKNGRIKRKCQMIHGYEHGAIVGYHENGNLSVEFTKENGNIEGEFKVYDYDGNLVRVEYWKDSKMRSEDTKVIKKWEVNGTPEWQRIDGELVEFIWKDGELIKKE